MAPLGKDSSVSNRSAGRNPGDGWIQLAPSLWQKISDGPRLLPDRFPESLLLPAAVNNEDLLFYDLETTGLSGGAGTVAFLIGLGRQLGDVFRVTQLFLSDYPGEGDLLSRFEELISDTGPQVSFNGRSFDSQVLKNRFLLNRRRPPSAMQVDLLYPARRMWRSLLPNVTLGTLERELLGVVRSNDLPGREAPDAWFEWLDGSENQRIEGVFRHNEEDLRSLARLLSLIESWASWIPENGAPMPPSLMPFPFGMARQCAFEFPEKQQQWLRYGWKLGQRRCGWAMALQFRREGNLDAAREIWETMYQGSRDFSAAVEISKYWEHHRKDPARALRVLEPLEQLPLSEKMLAELTHRRARLERKIRSRRL